MVPYCEWVAAMLKMTGRSWSRIDAMIGQTTRIPTPMWLMMRKTGPASRPATLSLAPDTVSISVSCRSGPVRSCSFFYRLQASY